MNPEHFLERFSSHLKNVIARAISLASSMNNPEVTPLHLLAAMTQEQGSVGAILLERFSLDTQCVLDSIGKDIVETDEATRTTTLPELNAQAKQTLERAMLLAYEHKHTHVGTEHLLSGILSGRIAAITTILKKKKIERKKIQKEVQAIILGTSTLSQNQSGNAQNADMMQMQDLIDSQEQPQEGMLPPPPKPQRATDVFTQELTKKELAKKIDPVIGRENEIERLIHILCRRNKNNPILVGEPGVGKTAIVEGLAARIASGDVPHVLRRKKILSLDMTMLIAGTIYRGEFEARIKQLMDELAKEPNSILFIDEIHTIIGAGANQGSMDAANILKPALARGELRCIGATTADEFEKHITTDPALERRFQKIHIEEPTVNETIEILEGVKQQYEQFHKVRFTPDAIDAAVRLSNKYIHDTHLPDKAIDLLDEAAAATRSEQRTSPEEEKKHTLVDKLDMLQAQKEKAISQEQFDKALTLKEKEKKVKKDIAAIEKQQSQKKAIKHTRVQAQDVVRVLSRRLVIDSKHITENELDTIERVEKELRTRILGQDHVIDQLSQLLKQSSLALDGSQKPHASFLFVGPSGVGKTALAKELARTLYHNEKALITFNMSEFAEAHSVSKILGSPAGYIGHKERNRFTDELKKRPHSIVLFDEFDKAHADVQKLLFQMLDEGVVTDSHGKKISLQHAIIILTTNIGADLFASAGIGFGMNGKNKGAVDNQIRKKLKEELSTALVSRIQSTCIFKPLDTDIVKQIVTNQLTALSAQLEQTQSIRITPDTQSVHHIAKQAFSHDTGARNISKIIQQTVHDLVLDVIASPKKKKAYTLKASGESYKLI